MALDGEDAILKGVHVSNRLFAQEQKFRVGRIMAQ